MELALGVLQWSPDQFWAATHRELMAALDGWNEKNGNPRAGESRLPVSRDELEDMMRRYPDGG